MKQLGNLEVEIYASEAPEGYVDVEVRLKGSPQEPVPEREVAFAILIDKSKSMAEFDKLQHAIQAAKEIIDSMPPNNIVAVYAFDEKIKTLIPPLPAEKAQKLAKRLEKLKPGTYTLLYQALLHVIEELRGVKKGPLRRGAVPEDAVKRIVVITDGEPWPYYTEERWYESLGRSAAKYGITISAIGIGQDYNEKILHTLATSSGGAWYHITSAGDLSRVLANELRRASTVAARHVKITIEPTGAELTEVRKIGPTVSKHPPTKEVEIEEITAGEVVSTVFRTKPTTQNYHITITVATEEGQIQEEITPQKLATDRTATLTLAMAQELEKLAQGGVISVEVLRAVADTETTPEHIRKKAQKLLQEPHQTGKEAYWDATVTLTLEEPKPPTQPPTEATPQPQQQTTTQPPATEPTTPQPTSQAVKCVVTCPETGKSIEVQLPALLGREDLQPILPPGRAPYISRRIGERAHLKIYTTPQGIYIEDAGSKGGIYIEGKRVTQPTPLPNTTINLAGVADIKIECK
jgi:Ca-activated chloride channel family protein